MPAKQLIDRCWVIAERDPEYDAHYKTEAAARGDDGRQVKQLDPCWIVTCDPGGDDEDPLEDGEYEWTLHAPSREQAEKWALDYGWIVTRDGETICPDHAPDCSGADLAVVEQIPGQITMDEEVDTDA